MDGTAICNHVINRIEGRLKAHPNISLYQQARGHFTDNRGAQGSNKEGFDRVDKETSWQAVRHTIEGAADLHADLCVAIVLELRKHKNDQTIQVDETIFTAAGTVVRAFCRPKMALIGTYCYWP